jgi:alpha-glucuronidase
VLDHWDNLDRYGGARLCRPARCGTGGTLPEWRDPRYTDYARANASLGINGTVLNNVNCQAAEPDRADYLAKAAALADMFRPYGIRVYLSARFTRPSNWVG